MPQYALGLDYGTNSVRGLLVEVGTGRECAASVFDYPHGDAGVITSSSDPFLARQNPEDYLDGTIDVVANVLSLAREIPGFSSDQVIGIGVDTTGSTPIPVDATGSPLAFNSEFSAENDALVILWKDHTAYAEAEEITQLARQIRPEYLAKCGGKYSSEWFWAKMLHICRTNPAVFDATSTWVEHADWMPAVLTGTSQPRLLQRGICAAGHKCLYSATWGGYPDEQFLSGLDPGLCRVRRTLPDEVFPVGNAAGGLTTEWADRLGLKEGTPVSIGAIDAHIGAIGAGIKPGTLVKIIGTSTCDLMIAPFSDSQADIPGLCGIVPGSILPDYYGLEAGQSAVGDIFNWFVRAIKPAHLDHQALTEGAAKLTAGESGLIALDWHNGNRTVLVDQQLTGSIFGLTLHTNPFELYRALIEATAFGARVIMERLEESGQAVDTIVTSGGISSKSPMVMQIYADVMGKPIHVSASKQTCALGAAICGAVAAGVYDSFGAAVAAMASPSPVVYVPQPVEQRRYHRLYAIYRSLHDAFGLKSTMASLHHVMKDLLELREEVRAGVHEIERC